MQMVADGTPPNFGLLSRAFEMANLLPESRPCPLDVCVVGPRGLVVATARLSGYERAELFVANAERAGYVSKFQRRSASSPFDLLVVWSLHVSAKASAAKARQRQGNGAE